MKKAILATKVGMTQIFNADGVLVPVTVLEAGPCSVTQIKTVENDGYSAVQVAFADKKERIITNQAGFFFIYNIGGNYFATFSSFFMIEKMNNAESKQHTINTLHTIHNCISPHK